MTSKTPESRPGKPAVVFRELSMRPNLEPLVDRVLAERTPVIWLDSARTQTTTGRWSVVGWDPWLTLTSAGAFSTLRTGASTITTDGDPFDLLRHVLLSYPGPVGLPAPIGVGLFVALGYELNRWIERLPPVALDGATPDLLAYGMRQMVVVDHELELVWAMSVVDPSAPLHRAAAEAVQRLQRLEDWLTIDSSEPLRDEGSPIRLEPDMPQAAFESMVRRAQGFIAAGDIFQANLSHRISGPWSGSPWALYRRLRRVNPSSFACFLSAPELSLVSCSPERLVQVQGRRIVTRPIAGTRPRGRRPEEDLMNSIELLLSDKERAEHLMLVDLARNDLGRVCRFGSVEVDEMMGLEDYSHVIHLVSNVQGLLRDDVDAVDVIRAVFPGGTITGCPKVRSMEIIQMLEPIRRGFYTGSCGYLGFDGAIDLNILIRTLVIQGDAASFHVGAGIVADSRPEREYRETLAKAGALLKALEAEVDSTEHPVR